MLVFGSYEVVVVVIGEINEYIINVNFLNLLVFSNLRYIGWLVWCDSCFFIDDFVRLFVFDGYWEVLIVSLDRGFGDYIDYWCLSFDGKFYLYRVL